MSVSAFDPKELEVKGQTFTMNGPAPIYSFPVSMREGYIAAVRDRKPIWEITGIETMIFTPRIIPDNVARGFVYEGAPFDAVKYGGGPDMFGVEWEYIKQVGGSMVRPGNAFIEDMNDWPEKVKWPEPDKWDWEGSAKENEKYLSGDFCYQAWFQTGWFERLISFMEFEGAIMALIDEDQKEAVNAFLDKLSDTYIEIIENFIKYFPQVDSFYMHDDWGAQKETFFAPAIVEEMIVPHMRKVTDFIHSKGKIAELHSCGQIMKQVPNIIAAGWDTWNGQKMNDTQKIYELYGDKIVLGVIPDQFDPATTSEADQRAMAKAFADKFCKPGKPSVVNIYGTACFTPAYREELYKASRENYAK